MAEYTQRFGEQAAELSVEERNLLSGGVQECRRQSDVLRGASSPTLSRKRRPRAASSRRCTRGSTSRKGEAELQKICDGILGLMDNDLIPLARTEESKVLDFKVKGDYCRYLAECATRDAVSNAAVNARVAYAEDTKTAEKDLVVTHPIRVSLTLNFLCLPI